MTVYFEAPLTKNQYDSVAKLFKVFGNYESGMYGSVSSILKTGNGSNILFMKVVL